MKFVHKMVDFQALIVRQIGASITALFAVNNYCNHRKPSGE